MDFEMSTKSSTELQLEDKENASRELKKEWVNRLEKFGDNSTFSAVVYEFKSKSILKRILWTLIVVVATGGFCYITAESIRMLIREPIATSITENRQTELEFPAVTVCSLSFLDATVLRGFSGDLVNDLDNLFNSAGPQNTPPLTQCMDMARDIAHETNRDIGFGELVSNVARNDIRRLILECSFQGEDCTNEIETINTISGVCFTFNGPKAENPQTVQGTGVRQGLRLQLLNGDQVFSLNDNYGFNVIVHNQDEPPRPESEGVVIGLGSALYVGMQQVTSEDKTKFFSGQQCVRDLDISSNNLTFSDYNSYSRSLCLNDCFYTHLADQCQCVERSFYTPARSPYTEMTNCGAEHFCCEVNTFETYKDNCNCPLRCETVDRTLTVSSATHSIDDRSRVGINVYYETLVTEARETTDSYTPWSLISDIGGNTGLFLGFTLLTVGEVVLLALALCTDCCCSSCKKRLREKMDGCRASVY